MRQNIVFGSRSQHSKLASYFPTNILGNLIHAAGTFRNLGVKFDADFSLSEHVKKTCKAYFFQMHDSHRIRQYLTCDTAILAANALVSSLLDYCNSILRGISSLNQKKLQSIQNSMARVLTNQRKYDHVTPILKQLH